MTVRAPLILPPALDPLINQSRWVVWKWITGKNGKPTKPPFQGRAPDRHASSTDPTTWCDLKTAMGTYCAGRCDGIGFTLNGGGIGASTSIIVAMPLQAPFTRGQWSWFVGAVPTPKSLPAGPESELSERRAALRCTASFQYPKQAA